MILSYHRELQKCPFEAAVDRNHGSGKVVGNPRDCLRGDLLRHLLRLDQLGLADLRGVVRLLQEDGELRLRESLLNPAADRKIKRGTADRSAVSLT